MFQNNKIVPLALFLGLLVLALFLVSSRRQPSSSSTVQQVNSFQSQTTSSSATKLNSEGAVTVEVTPIVLNAGENPKFKVTFTTHSVELDFNVENIVNLVDDRGNIVKSPKWIGTPAGGHHRSGELDFDDTLSLSAKSVKLTFRNIAGISAKIFTYELLRKP